MIPFRRIPGILIVLIPLVTLAAGCRHVGSGTLNPLPNASIHDPAARQGAVVSVDVYRAGPRQDWPPQGKIALSLRAENFPAIDCGVQCTYLQLRRLSTAAEPTGNPPFVYRTCEELIAARGPLISWHQPGLQWVGKVDIGADHAISEWLLVDDTPDNREATWVLTDEGLGGYRPIRCGKVIVAPP